MLPHAPQFFTLPPSEDRATVARVKQVAAEIGQKLKALAPELWIIFANDHAEQFFHTVAPPFTIHVGGEAEGAFAGCRFHWPVAGEIGLELVRRLYQEGFDPAFTSTAGIDYAIGIPLTHLGLAGPVLPISVEIGLELVRRLYQEGFDPAFTSTAGIDYAIGIPLTHLGLAGPVLPIWV